VKRRSRRFAVVVMAGLAVAALAAVLWPTDRDRVQGTWAGAGGRLTFDGHLAVRTVDGRDWRTYYQLDPWARPKRIVLWDADAHGPAASGIPGLWSRPPKPTQSDLICRGIYELDGDRLRICLPLPGAPFPTAFDPAAGAVLEFRRE
jgi:uncharacterized protein (TIGR03067 family)